MPLQNRVTPFGRLEAVSARGAWLGNRGILHNERKEIIAPWRNKAWITCRLQWPGVHRAVFSPHTWSELFFLDEATAFAAGHRPCAYCRRDRYNQFKRAWSAANAVPGHAAPLAAQIDARLHLERVARDGSKITYRERFGRLPPGTFIVLEGVAFLIWRGKVFPWSHQGYGPSRQAPANTRRVSVLTPASIVAMFRQGFEPQVDASA